MSEKFQNRYRIPSARLQNWDYSWAAIYSITVCTKNREHYFGAISDGMMQLSEIGKMAETEWLKTVEMRPDMNLTMGEYVVMPNHFHAIIGIGENEYNTVGDNVNANNNANVISGVTTDITTDLTMNMPNVETQCIASLHSANPSPTSPTKNKFGPQRKNLASIIRGFKIGVTINARKIHADFAWQSRYHDRIIRNDQMHERIRNYIVNNPSNWNNDEFYHQNDR